MGQSELDTIMKKFSELKRVNSELENVIKEETENYEKVLNNYRNESNEIIVEEMESRSLKRQIEHADAINNSLFELGEKSTIETQAIQRSIVEQNENSFKDWENFHKQVNSLIEEYAKFERDFEESKTLEKRMINVHKQAAIERDVLKLKADLQLNKEKLEKNEKKQHISFKNVYNYSMHTKFTEYLKKSIVETQGSIEKATKNIAFLLNRKQQ